MRSRRSSAAHVPIRTAFLSWVLFITGDFGEESKGAPFIVPWLNLSVICIIAFTASMLMTFLPARGASHVPVAEALRYEFGPARVSTDADVANACLFLASDASRQITGVDLPVDGGWAML